MPGASSYIYSVFWVITIGMITALVFLYKRNAFLKRLQEFQGVSDSPNLLFSLDQVHSANQRMKAVIDSGDWESIEACFEQLNKAQFQFLGCLNQLSWWAKLNETERSVALMLMRFRSSKDIAEAAELSPRYVNNVRSILREKLGLSTDVDLSEFLMQEASNLDLGFASNRTDAPQNFNDLGDLRTEVKRVKSQRHITTSNQAKMQQLLRKLSQQLPVLNASSGCLDWAVLQGFEFTSTERQVIELLTDGYSNGSISDILGCSMSRLYQHRAAIRSKMGLSRFVKLEEHLRSLLKTNE